MSRGLLDPKVDFVFKNIFGSEKNPEILISFLNAILKPTKKIIHVEIKGTDIPKQFIEDKYSRLDVKATASNNEIINIEIQLKTEFLKDPESEKVRGLELTIDEIRKAKDELVKMSNDDEQRIIYDMRANALRDKISELNEAEKKGIEQGIEQGMIKSKKEDILDLLFDIGDVSDEIKNEIEAIDDIEKLKRLLKIAAKIDSLEEFEKLKN